MSKLVKVMIQLGDGKQVEVKPKKVTFKTLKMFKGLMNRVGKPLSLFLSSPTPQGKTQKLPVDSGNGQVGTMDIVEEPSLDQMQTCYDIKAKNLEDLIDALTDEENIDFVTGVVVAHAKGITEEQFQELSLDQAIILITEVVKFNMEKLSFLGKLFMGTLAKK